MNRLTGKQRLFVAEYLATMNATEAARRAGYRGNDVTLSAVGYENLRKPQLAEQIEQGLRKKTMGAEEVLARLAEQARGSIEDFVTIDEKGTPTLDLKQAKERGKLHLVRKLVWGKDGLRFELYSAKEALDLIGRRHGLWKDDSGKGSAEDPLHTVQMSMEEWRAEAEKRRAAAEATLSEDGDDGQAAGDGADA